MNPLMLEPPSLSTLVTQLASLPPHDPTRYQTNDGLDEPDCTKGLGVAQGMSVLGFFERENHYHERHDSSTVDLICNLLHLAHERGQEPSEILTTALWNFLAEAGSLKTECA